MMEHQSEVAHWVESQVFHEKNGEKSPLKILQDKLEEQNELISLMQAQLDIQTEKLSRQDKVIEELTMQVKTLELKEQQRNESDSKSGDKKASVDVTNGWTNGNITSQNGTTLADMVKEVAENTLAQTGFVYDENSKLYFHYASGYYYDPVQCLYYNGNTRTYYSYNSETQQYTFHSQLSPLPSPPPEHPNDDDIKFLKRKRNTIRAGRQKPSNLKIGILKPEPKEVDDTIKKESVEVKPKQTVKKVAKKVKDLDDDIEDGEISSSDSSCCEVPVELVEKVSELVEISDSGSESEDSIKELDVEPAPCIRAIVNESTVPELRKGFLFLVPCTGGTIGREGSQHTILIEDENVSKLHARITYGYNDPTSQKVAGDTDNEDEVETVKVKITPRAKYLICDLGSRNGTFLNGTRLSETNLSSGLVEICHGSTLMVGDTTLLLHIHPGDRTCGHCEPGLVMVKEPLYAHVQGKATKEASRRKELKKIRNKYGIQHPSVVPRLKVPSTYTDRAEERRTALGSDNPFEKTEVASIDQPIQPSNKGFKMMSMMGWSVGESLGQTDGAGIQEPIKIKFKKGRGGLGADEPPERPIPEANLGNLPQRKKKKPKRGPGPISKAQLLQKTRKRFEECNSSTSAAGPSSRIPEFTID